MNGSKKLGMTIEQMEMEIYFMRGWDKYLRENMVDEDYSFLSKGYAREHTLESLKAIGATDKQAKEACDYAEGEMK